MSFTEDSWLYNEIEKIARNSQRLLWYLAAKKTCADTAIIRVLEDFTGGTKEVNEQVPPKYMDGSFRTIGNSGLLQYRFMLNGKQCTVYGYSEQECWQKRAEYKPRLTMPAKTEKTEKPQRLTYKMWSDWWLKEKKPKCKPSYYKATVMYLKNDILPFLGNKDIKDLTTEGLQLFLEKIPKDNKRTKVAAILSESIRRAYELQKIPFNVFLGVRFEKYISPHKRALTHAEQLILLDNIKDDKLRVLTKLLLLTGLRQGEALALTADDIESDTIRVTKTWDKIIDTPLPPKTKASVRTVPICKDLYDTLKPHILKGRVFNYKNDYISTFYSDLFKSLKIKATGHSLRHTFITNAYEIGVPAHIVQRWAGHAKAEQADTYLDLRKSKDFKKTWIVDYMIALKDKFVPKV